MVWNWTGLRFQMRLMIFFVDVAQQHNHDLGPNSVTNKNDRAIFFEPVTHFEVISAFMSLNNSSSSDAEGIQVPPTKYVLVIIAPCLTDIFNICFSTPTFL